MLSFKLPHSLLCWLDIIALLVWTTTKFKWLYPLQGIHSFICDATKTFQLNSAIMWFEKIRLFAIEWLMFFQEINKSIFKDIHVDASICKTMVNALFLAWRSHANCGIRWSLSLKNLNHINIIFLVETFFDFGCLKIKERWNYFIFLSAFSLYNWQKSSGIIKNVLTVTDVIVGSLELFDEHSVCADVSDVKL